METSQLTFGRQLKDFGNRLIPDMINAIQGTAVSRNAYSHDLYEALPPECHSMARAVEASLPSFRQQLTDGLSNQPGQSENFGERACTRIRNICFRVMDVAEAKFEVAMFEPDSANDVNRLAYGMAKDDGLRTAVGELAARSLSPTPLETNPNVTNNQSLNGLSGKRTFLTERKERRFEKMNKLDNMVMCLNAGLDQDMEPDTRKLFLKEAGLSREQVDELVPLSDYVTYETRVRDRARERVLKDILTSDGHELTENEQSLIDMMTSDLSFGYQMYDPVEREPRVTDCGGVSTDEYLAFLDRPLDESLAPFETAMKEDALRLSDADLDEIATKVDLDMSDDEIASLVFGDEEAL